MSKTWLIKEKNISYPSIFRFQDSSPAYWRETYHTEWEMKFLNSLLYELNSPPSFDLIFWVWGRPNPFYHDIKSEPSDINLRTNRGGGGWKYPRSMNVHTPIWKKFSTWERCWREIYYISENWDLQTLTWLRLYISFFWINF